jgi:hypothetical protein
VLMLTANAESLRGSANTCGTDSAAGVFENVNAAASTQIAEMQLVFTVFPF